MIENSISSNEISTKSTYLKLVDINIKKPSAIFNIIFASIWSNRHHNKVKCSNIMYIMVYSSILHITNQ